MGLDVYVGTMTRYLSGDWKTIVQQWGEQSGCKTKTLERVARFALAVFVQLTEKTVSERLPVILDY